MSKKILYLLGIALTLILGMFLYQNYCCNCCMKPPKLDDSTTVVNNKRTGLVPFTIKGSDFDYHCNDNIKFVKNETAALVPFSDSVAIGFKNLKTALQSNPNKKIKITGYSTSDEKNTTTFPNLALARANDLKKYLISTGFDANSFVLEGEIKDKWEMISDTLIGPASFNIIENEPASNNQWEVLKAKINANPLILYFNTNESRENLSTEELTKIAEIATYLKNVPNAKVSIVGHSDSVGAREANIVLGQSRAEFAKAFLIKKGIDSKQIETSSQGPDNPIADNTSEEGKSKNRRTVVTIK
jgi:OOP family OmpA-OmpF porin